MGNIVSSGALGFVVGDALGLAYQNKSRKDMESINIVMDSYIEHLKGSWSDDSSTMLCTMESLSNGLDYKDMAKRLHMWLTQGYMTPGDIAFGAGKTTVDALNMFSEDIDPLTLGINHERSLGNGSLMRMLPLAYYLYTKNYDINKNVEIIKNVSSITHSHKIPIMACIIYTLFTMSLIEGNTMWNAYIDLKEKIETLRNNEDFSEDTKLFDRIIDNNIIMYEEKEISSSGYCIDTLESVFWCFLNGDGYEDCITKAIRLGGDTDTIAALTGALAGIYYGEEDINPTWINTIIKKEKIESVSDDFYKYLKESTN